MQMLQSDWLNYRTLSAISVQWLDVVNKMATFSRFSEVLKKHLETNE